MSAPLLLAISPPCLQPVNRTVFRILREKHGVDVHLVIPSRSYVGGAWKESRAVGNEAFPVTLLEPTHKHPRLRTFSGLGSLIEKLGPTHILLEEDPASMLAREVVRSSRAPGKKASILWAMTAENLPPRYAGQIMRGVCKLDGAKVFGQGLTWWLRKTLGPCFDLVFTLSKDGTEVLETMGFRNRVRQIPLGFDPELFIPQSEEEVAATRRDLGLTQPTVAYFGRITPEKGIHLLVEALSMMKDVPWQFLIDRFSDYRSPYEGTLRKLLEPLDSDGRVVFFDAVHEEMPRYMNAADVVVLPSISTPEWKEQYGRVVPEAMACGKLVIGSRSGAIPEIIGEAGFTFPEGDAGALADSLRSVLSLPLETAAAWGKAAEARAHGSFSAAVQAGIYADLLRG